MNALAMNAMNAGVRDALSAALGTLHRLADAGETVLGVELGSGLPCLTLEAPRGAALWAGAQLRTQYGPLGVRRHLYATERWGCRLVWDARATPPPEAARAAG